MLFLINNIEEMIVDLAYMSHDNGQLDLHRECILILNILDREKRRNNVTVAS